MSSLPSKLKRLPPGYRQLTHGERPIPGKDYIRYAKLYHLVVPSLDDIVADESDMVTYWRANIV